MVRDLDVEEHGAGKQGSCTGEFLEVKCNGRFVRNGMREKGTEQNRE